MPQLRETVRIKRLAAVMDSRENQGDLSKFRVFNESRHITVVHFNLSGDAMVGQSLGRGWNDTWP